MERAREPSGAGIMEKKMETTAGGREGNAQAVMIGQGITKHQQGKGRETQKNTPSARRAKTLEKTSDQWPTKPSRGEICPPTSLKGTAPTRNSIPLNNGESNGEENGK